MKIMVIQFLRADELPPEINKPNYKIIFTKAMLVLQRLSRRIAHFLDDNKAFKVFVFQGNNYQKTILKYATVIAKVMRASAELDKNKEKNKFHNPAIVEGGYL